MLFVAPIKLTTPVAIEKGSMALQDREFIEDNNLYKLRTKGT